MPNFQNVLVLAISTDENNPITFLELAPEASPVLTIGKYSKGTDKGSCGMTGPNYWVI